jgi:hypothetical protein
MDSNASWEVWATRLISAASIVALQPRPDVG